MILLGSIYDEMVDELKKVGGYFCSAEERKALKQAMWPDGIHLNKEIVAQSIGKIAPIANIPVPEKATFLMVEGEEISTADPFCRKNSLLS